MTPHPPTTTAGKPLGNVLIRATSKGAEGDRPPRRQCWTRSSPSQNEPRSPVVRSANPNRAVTLRGVIPAPRSVVFCDTTVEAGETEVNGEHEPVQRFSSRLPDRPISAQHRSCRAATARVCCPSKGFCGRATRPFSALGTAKACPRPPAGRPRPHTTISRDPALPARHPGQPRPPVSRPSVGEDVLPKTCHLVVPVSRPRVL